MESNRWSTGPFSASMRQPIYEIFIRLRQSCLANEREHFWACINGWIEKQDDKKATERFWSAKVEAWYEHGIKDDNILLLALHPETAEVSCSTRSLLRFTWEIAKANISHREQPDVSAHARIRVVNWISDALPG